jgi:hypothetical protein
MSPTYYPEFADAVRPHAPQGTEAMMLQPMLHMHWAGNGSNPNAVRTLPELFPRLHALPRMDHWWRAGRHTLSLVADGHL